MTIDERLDRLTERHEALSQSLELLAADLRSLEKNVESLAASTSKTDKNVESLTGFVGEIAQGTARLLHIAQIHEQRITRLEDKGT